MAMQQQLQQQMAAWHLAPRSRLLGAAVVAAEAVLLLVLLLGG
jgi:hypothetical protein